MFTHFLCILWAVMSVRLLGRLEGLEYQACSFLSSIVVSPLVEKGVDNNQIRNLCIIKIIFHRLNHPFLR